MEMQVIAAVPIGPEKSGPFFVLPGGSSLWDASWNYV
jgi:hypothetical protein